MNALETTEGYSPQGYSPEDCSDASRAPDAFNEYVERELHERTRAAYEQGLDHGSKYRLGALLLGMLLGWLAGLSVRIIG